MGTQMVDGKNCGVETVFGKQFVNAGRIQLYIWCHK